MLTPTTPEHFVPRDHPLRDVKRLADEALSELSEHFDAMYSARGRRSVPPETLLKSTLLMAFFSVRSERQFCQQLGFNLLFKWFLDMNLGDEPFDPTVFTKNRNRLLDHKVANLFLARVVEQARSAGLMSAEHFSVDGTLIQAWGSMKSFKPKDDDDEDSNGFADFKGTKRSNDTHESKTDPDAKLRRKGRGQEAKLSLAGHALMENRNGLIVDLSLTSAVGVTEPEAALDLLEGNVDRSRATVGADAGYNTKKFVAECRENGITPHVAGKKLHSAIDDRTRRHAGYAASQKVRKRIEQIFGWMKTYAGFRKCRLRGLEKNGLLFQMAGAAYNLLRIAKLQAA